MSSFFLLTSLSGICLFRSINNLWSAKVRCLQLDRYGITKISSNQRRSAYFDIRFLVGGSLPGACHIFCSDYMAAKPRKCGFLGLVCIYFLAGDNSDEDVPDYRWFTECLEGRRPALA